MADDLDEQIRRAMKTLDDEVPPGYFERLPNVTLARLEEDGSDMDSQGTRQKDVPVPTHSAPPLMTNDREEDSGLHDIRNLASSAKKRMSARRSTQSPVVSEDDVLASSSAGWKAVALPEPAKMVSLPELAELPSAVEIERADKAARTAAKRTKAEVAAPVAATATESVATEALPPVAAFGSRIAPKQSGGKGKTVALVGVLVAAAAGVGVFLVVNNKDTAAPASATSESKVAVATEAPVLKRAPESLPPPVAPEPVVEPAAVVAPPPEVVEDAKPVAKADAKDKKAHKVEIRDTVNSDKPLAKEKPAKEEPKAKGDDGEPSFDALLKEGGITDQAKAAKPKLDKTSLNQSDFKTGMSAVAGRAQGCFKGTQGTAMVKLSVAPDGSVAKVTVTGQFAGTPEATCVEGAVKSAKFPAWDGGPQSFNYSYLLAE